MGISETSLQRKEAIRKVSDEVKVEIDAGNITATAAAELASMDAEEQNSVVEAIKDRGEEVTVQAVKEEKKKIVVPKNDFTSGVKESPTECKLEDEGQTKLFGQEKKMELDENNGVDCIEAVVDEIPSIQNQESIDKNFTAKIWFQKEIAEKVKEAEKRLAEESADETEDTCQEWQARIKVMKGVLAYLGSCDCQERCKACCDDCERPCEHSKNFQALNDRNN